MARFAGLYFSAALTLFCHGVVADVLVQRIGDAPAQTFARIEWEIDPQTAYDNPFDPAIVAIDATFTGPDGKTLILPAFWSQPFKDNDFGFDDDNTAAPAGAGRWLVRFAPPAAGKWALVVQVRDHAGQRSSAALPFEVGLSKDQRGLVRRAAGSRYFQFDNGESFFPIGLNIAWTNKAGVPRYEQLLKDFAAGGGNFARIWMCKPNRWTENTRTGVGKMDLASCAFYDRVLDAADRNGVRVLLTFNNYRDLRLRDNWGACVWPDFPYNAANGGPATRRADFFTHPDARRIYRNRLRYVAARYSAYTNIALWEFFNEEDLAGVPMPPDWLSEMSEYLHAVDPYHHLITTSFSNIPATFAWQASLIDLTQVHYYGDGQYVTDVAAVVRDAVAEHAVFNKPFMVGELGISPLSTDADYDKNRDGSFLHDGLWASVMSGAAGSSCHWWWDTYIDAQNLWSQYSGVAKFTAAVDWARRRFQPLVVALPIRTKVEPGKTEDLVLQCTGGWGVVADKPIIVEANGQVSTRLPRYLVGPAKLELHKPLELRVNLAKPADLTLRISEVCDFATLRVSIDGKPAADFGFSALPGMPDVEHTRTRDDNPQMYQAAIGKDRVVPLPAGKHTVSLLNIAGEWLTVGTIRISGAKESRSADLAVLALRDSSAGDTLLWLHDTQANWVSARDGKTPRTLDDVELTLPATAPQRVIWWDTRTGNAAEPQTVTPTGGQVQLRVPAFTRDIALRCSNSQ